MKSYLLDIRNEETSKCWNQKLFIAMNLKWYYRIPADYHLSEDGNLVKKVFMMSTDMSVYNEEIWPSLMNWYWILLVNIRGNQEGSAQNPLSSKIWQNPPKIFVKV